MTTDHTTIHIFTMIMVPWVNSELLYLSMTVKLSSEISSDLTSNQVRLLSHFLIHRKHFFKKSFQI